MKLEQNPGQIGIFIANDPYHKPIGFCFMFKQILITANNDSKLNTFTSDEDTVWKGNQNIKGKRALLKTR